MTVQDLENLRIVAFPDPVLSRPAKEVDAFDDRLRDLACRMIEKMKEANGVGLAAPQVSESIRLFVCNATGNEQDDMAIVNPKFTELAGAEDREEGCLSIPGVTVTMRRATRVILEAFDLRGEPVKLGATDLLARIWQHECDHLNGRLIIDRMSASDEIANRRAIKQLKDQYKPRS